MDAVGSLGAALVGIGCFSAAYGWLGTRLPSATSDDDDFAPFHRRWCPTMLTNGVRLLVVGMAAARPGIAAPLSQRFRGIA